jgi:hypothetical protein
MLVFVYHNYEDTLTFKVNSGGMFMSDTDKLLEQVKSTRDLIVGHQKRFVDISGNGFLPLFLKNGVIRDFNVSPVDIAMKIARYGMHNEKTEKDFNNWLLRVGIQDTSDWMAVYRNTIEKYAEKDGLLVPERLAMAQQEEDELHDLSKLRQPEFGCYLAMDMNDGGRPFRGSDGFGTPEYRNEVDFDPTEQMSEEKIMDLSNAQIRPLVRHYHHIINQPEKRRGDGMLVQPKLANPHHIEYHKDGIRGMTIVDVNSFAMDNLETNISKGNLPFDKTIDYVVNDPSKKKDFSNVVIRIKDDIVSGGLTIS